MSSSSANPGAAAPSGAGQASSITSNQVLDIPAPHSPQPRALDQGTWFRIPEPLTIRYRAAAGVAPITDLKRQEDVTRAIWTRLGDLIPEQPPPKSTFYIALGIVFDHEVIWPDVLSIIDIVCSDFESCNAISSELKEIHVRDGFGGVSIFKQSSMGGELPQDILPFDIFQTYVTMPESSHWRASKFVPTLKAMASKVGELTGPVRMLWTTLGGSKFDRMIRGYIKLSNSSMQLSYEELVHRKDGWLDWIGFIRIVYSDKHLRSYKDWALQKLQRTARIEGRNSGQSSTSTHGAGGGAASTSSNGAKKRKAKDEQSD